MKVIKNYLYNAGYQILVLIIPLITAPYISRTLGPTGVGEYTYTYSIITWFMLITNIGVSYYGDRQIAYVRNDKYLMSKTFWEIQIVKLFMTFVSICFFILLLQFYSKYRILLLIQSINILAATVDISWLYMGLEDFKRTVTRNFIIKLISVICIFLFIHKSTDTWLYILIMALSVLLGNLTLWLPLKNLLVKVKFDELTPFIHFRESLILFVPSIATTIYLILNKTLLGMIVNATASGYYNNSDQLIRMVEAIVTATGTVMLPHMANEYAKGHIHKIKNMLYTSFDFVSFVSFPMAFGLAAVSIKLAPFFYGKDFEIVGKLMLIEAPVIVLIAWSNAIGVQYMLPTKQSVMYTKSLLYSALFSIIINIPFILLYGVYGSVITTVLTEIVVTIYQLFLVRKQISISKLFKNTLKYLLASTVMFVIVFYLNMRWDFNIIFAILEVLIGIVIYIIIILLLKPTIVNQFSLILGKIQKKSV